MTPRTEIVGLEHDVSIADATAKFLETGFSRLPLYQESVDHIVGVLLAHDVWRAREEGVKQIAQLIRPVQYVPDTKPLEKLLEEMRRDRVHLVIVLDEFGGTHGMVTMEDVVEEVIGEISDEDEPAAQILEKRPDGSYLMPGDYALSDLNDELSVDLPLDDADSVAGFIMNKLGRVPAVGDVVDFRGGVFEVRLMRGRRVVQAELRLSTQAGPQSRQQSDEGFHG
jgi:putative hemolysin